MTQPKTSRPPMTSAQRWVLVIASLASFVAALDTIVVSTALTAIRLDLHATVEQLEWTVNAYNLTFAVLLMPAATLGDRYGRRRLFSTGLAVFAVGSAACALAPDPHLLVAARALQGVGAALITTLALALVSVAFPPERRGSALGLYFAITGLAIASGPLVGGAIAQGLSWHWIFWINVPLALAVVPFALRKLPESHGPSAPLDPVGLALVTTGAFGLVWGLVRGNPVGWGSVEVVGAFAVGAVALAAFARWELSRKTPMLDVTLFRSRAFSAGNASIFFTLGSLFCGVFFLAQFMQTVLGYGPFKAGAAILPWTATLFFTAPIAGVLVDRLGARPFMIAGPLLQALGMGLIALAAGPDASYLTFVPALVIAGVGVSMSFPGAQSSVISDAPPELVGQASGANSAVRELGGVFGIAISVAVFSAVGGYASAFDFADGFQGAMATSAALSLLGAAGGALLPRRVGGPAASAEAAVVDYVA